MFDADLETAARAHAQMAWPNESVGLAINCKYVPVDNTSATPLTSFSFNRKLMLQPGVEAVIHSHPAGDSVPSALDMEQQDAMRLPWGIVGASKEATSKVFWWGQGVPMPKLENRPYRFGPSGSDGRGDCYAIIRDWYQLERQVTLREVPRDEETWKAQTPWYETLFQSYGWSEISPTEVAIGDVVLMKIGMRVTNHAMLNLGNGLALHHQQGALSGRTPIGPWLRFRTHCLRYDGVSR